MHKQKILFLASGPTPYRCAFFAELGKLVDLTVVYEINHSQEREWQIEDQKGYKEITLKSWKRSVNNAFCPGVIKYLKMPFDHIVVGGYSTPTGMLAISWLRYHRKKFILNTDGGQLAPEGRLKHKIKRFFISKAHYWLSTSKVTTEYLLHYGAKADRIIPYPFTSLMCEDVVDAPSTAEEKTALREKLHITEKHMVLSVGRFTYLNGYGKGYDALIRAAQQLPEYIGWYIVGGAPTEEFVQIVKDTGLKNIHFVEFVNKKALKDYYRAADAFVLMTVGDVWGLVINEAMACGLPVITTDKCVAGLELIEEGKNGYIVRVGDHVALAEKIDQLITMPDKSFSMGTSAVETISQYTIENMAKIHAKAFKEIV